MEEYRTKKTEGVVFKIDFEKAYKHVNWNFVDEVLEKKGSKIDREGGLEVVCHRLTSRFLLMGDLEGNLGLLGD